LVQDDHTTTISIPFPFLLRFFVERAEDADWADRTQLFHLFNACASQPATFVGVLVQQMFGTELLDQSSPLYPQIRAVFEPHVDLHPILLIPPVKVFTRPSDIDGLVEISRAVYAVQDVPGGTEGRSTDVACPMLDQRTNMIRALKFEIKYGTPLVKDASTQNLELQKKGCEFFVKAAEENQTAKSKTLNVYVSLVKLKLHLKWGKELQTAVKKPENGLLHGPQIVEGCRQPFDLCFKARWSSTDYGRWQAGVRAALPSGYLPGAVCV
jgi:hypothetical protein